MYMREETASSGNGVQISFMTASTIGLQELELEAARDLDRPPRPRPRQVHVVLAIAKRPPRPRLEELNTTNTNGKNKSSSLWRMVHGGSPRANWTLK